MLLELSNNNVINLIAKSKIVELIIYLINRNENPEDLKDLIQDIYIVLLEKSPELIDKLYRTDEIKYYIANIVYTQLRSNTSPYHRKYRINHKRNIQLNENILKNNNL